MSNCDSAREREKEKERETETVPSTALPNCCETRLKWAFQYLRRDLANPHSVRSIPPTPLPFFSPSSPFLSLSHLPLLAWLAKHFLHWAFSSEFALVCAAYFKQFCDVNWGSAAQLLLLAASFFGFGFLSLAFAAILGLFMFCLAASCWGRMRPECSQCVCVMYVYVYLICMCLCVCVLGVSIVAA